ncbi:MAG: N-acetylglutaminylglutamine amidotransferase [Rhizobacter sp.]
MCGLAGAVRFDGLDDRYETTIERMLEAMVSRGPDGAGLHREASIALGHRRLVLLDAEGGAQPFYSEDGRVVVVFNGEIYNHRELHRTLDARGHRFVGYSDGEVIAHLYEEHGSDFVRHLDGMFAIAVYDRDRPCVVLARDRTGEKPLFYMEVDGTFFFASTMRALFTVPGCRRRLDPAGVLGYFAHTQPAAPATVFRGIRRVPPAHTLELRPGEPLIVRPYWTIDFTRKLSGSFDEAAERLDAVLQSAVDSTIDSDFPPALTLSGGVDSSLVLACMAKRLEAPVACFSLGSADPGDAEFHRASEVAKIYGVSPRRFLVLQTSYADMVESMRSFDEPVNVYDSIYLLQHSELIARTHRVVLTGNGADEVFGGYDGYLEYLAECGSRCIGKNSADAAMGDFLRDVISADADALYSPNGVAYAADYSVEAHLSSMLAIAHYEDPLDARMYYDLYFGMSHSASLADTVGMAHSLEYRAPFLSRSVIEFAASLPSQWKVSDASGGSTKVLLKSVASKYFPSALMNAPKLGCGHFIDRFELMRTQWQEDVEQAIVRHADLLRDHVCAERALRLWRSFVAGEISGHSRRRPLKLAMLLAWLDAHAHSMT